MSNGHRCRRIGHWHIIVSSSSDNDNAREVALEVALDVETFVSCCPARLDSDKLLGGDSAAATSRGVPPCEFLLNGLLDQS